MRLPWKLCFEQSILSIKRIYAFYQTCFYLRSNVNMIAIKYFLIPRFSILSILFCFNDRRYCGEKHLLKKQIKTKKVG